MRIASIVLLVLFGGAMALADDNALIPPAAKVEKLAGGMKFIEGPVWMDGFLVFSDIPQSKLMKWDGKEVTTFRENSNGTNGNMRDREGRLISCEHTLRRVTRTEKEGSITVLAHKPFDRWTLNSPNDVVVRADGTIWFTDPTYGLPKGQKEEIGGRFVFCLVPEMERGGFYRIQMLTKENEFDQPNGLCFSPDETKLYVADSGKPHHIRVYDIAQAAKTRIRMVPWELDNGRVFCVIDKGVPDGIRCDEKGNIWSSAGDGVQVFSPDGKLLARIAVPESPANLCFGGPDGKTLFMTARTSLYSISTTVRAATDKRK